MPGTLSIVNVAIVFKSSNPASLDWFSTLHCHAAWLSWYREDSLIHVSLRRPTFNQPRRKPPHCAGIWERRRNILRKEEVRLRIYFNPLLENKENWIGSKLNTTDYRRLKLKKNIFVGKNWDLSFYQWGSEKQGEGR